MRSFGQQRLQEPAQVPRIAEAVFTEALETRPWLNVCVSCYDILRASPLEADAGKCGMYIAQANASAIHATGSTMPLPVTYTIADANSHAIAIHIDTVKDAPSDAARILGWQRSPGHRSILRPVQIQGSSERVDWNNGQYLQPMTETCALMRQSR